MLAGQNLFATAHFTTGCRDQTQNTLQPGAIPGALKCPADKCQGQPFVPDKCFLVISTTTAI